MNNTENNEIKDDLEYIDITNVHQNTEDIDAPEQESGGFSSKMIHLIFGFALIIIIGLIIYKFWTWGTVVIGVID